MVESAAFKVWMNRMLFQGPTAEERVAKDMDPKNIKVEVRENGVWKQT